MKQIISDIKAIKAKHNNNNQQLGSQIKHAQCRFLSLLNLIY